MMKFGIMIVLLLCLFAGTVHADDEMVLLDIQVSVDGELVSEPRLAMKPGSDGSLMQGLESGDGLKVSFHSLHVTETGTTMLVDIDMLKGTDDRNGEHFRSVHREFAWGDPSEFVFGFGNGQNVTLTFTPSMTTRKALGK